MSAPTPLLVFQVAGQAFALGLAQVRSVVAAVETTPLPGAPAGVLGFFDMRGDLVPVLDVFATRGATARDIAVDDRFVLVDTGQRVVALVAQRVDGVVDVVAEPLSAIDGVDAAELPYAGVCRVAQGLVLIQDVEKFLSSAQSQALDDAMARLA